MERPDLSEYVIHFVAKYPAHGTREEILKKILREKRLKANNSLIKGRYDVVCFTEAPAGLFGYGEWHRYSQYGIMIPKKWLFERGGRPVIYQPVAEFSFLKEEARWRHMTYELRDRKVLTDYTWEREWRILGDLHFDYEDVEVVVPNERAGLALREEHDRDQDTNAQSWAIVLGEEMAQLYRSSFPWKVKAIEEHQHFHDEE